MLFALIALEKFAQTTENKLLINDRLNCTGTTQPTELESSSEEIDGSMNIPEISVSSSNKGEPGSVLPTVAGKRKTRSAKSKSQEGGLNSSNAKSRSTLGARASSSSSILLIGGSFFPITIYLFHLYRIVY